MSGNLTATEKLQHALGAIKDRSNHSSPLDAAARIESIVKTVINGAITTGSIIPSKEQMIAIVSQAFDAIIAGFNNPMIRFAAPFIKAILIAAISSWYDKNVKAATAA